MVERLDGLVPEMMLLALAVVVAVLGLSKARSVRRAVPVLTAGGLFVAAWLAWGGREQARWCSGPGGFGDCGSPPRTGCGIGPNAFRTTPRFTR